MAMKTLVLRTTLVLADIGCSWKGRVLSADVVLSILSDNCVAGSLPTWRIRGSSIVVGIQNECFGNKEME